MEKMLEALKRVYRMNELRDHRVEWEFGDLSSEISLILYDHFGSKKFKEWIEQQKIEINGG